MESAESDEERIQIISELRGFLSGVMGGVTNENLKIWCAIWVGSLPNEEMLIRIARILEKLTENIVSLEKLVKALEDEMGFRKEHK
ncbi:MAG: hypothetical protein FGF48_07220 [Candidatus Brockarchaeota archaeon]|nr:hypothetical protein [Candidatus Brockarchaeota archaeon]